MAVLRVRRSWRDAENAVDGHRTARRGARIGALLYVMATIVYAVAWDVRGVAQLCFQRDDGPPCPPPPDPDPP
jgi:hypothetical protein